MSLFPWIFKWPWHNCLILSHLYLGEKAWMSLRLMTHECLESTWIHSDPKSAIFSWNDEFLQDLQLMNVLVLVFTWISHLKPKSVMFSWKDFNFFQALWLMNVLVSTWIP